MVMDNRDRKKIVIWGASGHASVVANIVELNGLYEIFGFLDDFDPRRRDAIFCGAPILGGREVLSKLFDEGVRNIIMGFGDCLARIELSDFAVRRGFSVANAIHPSAVIAASATIGDGIVVVGGAVINPGAKIGNNVIVNTCASVDHDCIIGDGAHICPGARLAGRVEVGKASWIGIGATVVDGVRIGEQSVIGAGSVVLRDIPSHVTAYGVPAKVVEKRCLDSQ